MGENFAFCSKICLELVSDSITFYFQSCKVFSREPPFPPIEYHSCSAYLETLVRHSVRQLQSNYASRVTGCLCQLEVVLLAYVAPVMHLYCSIYLKMNCCAILCWIVVNYTVGHQNMGLKTFKSACRVSYCTWNRHTCVPAIVAAIYRLKQTMYLPYNICDQ